MVTTEWATGLPVESRTVTSAHTEPFAVTVTEDGQVDLEGLGIPAIAREKGIRARNAIAATIATRITIPEEIRRDMGPPSRAGEAGGPCLGELSPDSAPCADFGRIQARDAERHPPEF
jgi:hypothetical protein